MKEEFNQPEIDALKAKLSEANMGMREAFEAWRIANPFLTESVRSASWFIWKARQPEIDALKWKISSLEQDKMALADRALTFESESDRARKAYLEYEQENFLLKAENERLRAENDEITEKNHELWLEINGV